MDSDKINLLLEKYWKGESSIEEERALKEFFSHENIPSELRPVAPLFRYYLSVEKMTTQENFIPVTSLNKVPGKLNHDRKNHSIKFWYSGIAAAIILIFSITIIYKRTISVKKETVNIVYDTFNNPQDAYKESRKILLLVSQKLQKGENAVLKISRFNQAEKLIRKQKKL